MKESFLCLHCPHSCCPFTCVHLGCHTSHLSFSECTLTCLVSMSLTLLHYMRRVTCSVLSFLRIPLDSIQIPSQPQPLDCQAPPVSSRGKERARTSTPRPEPCRAPARVRPLGGLRVLGVQAKGVGSPLPPPLTSHRPSPQVLERGATRAPPTGPGLTFPAREALLAEEEEAGEGRALCLPRVLPRLQLGPSPSPSRPPELWSDGAGK